MKIIINKIKLQSHDHMPCFHDITSEVKDIVSKSNINNGLVTVYSHHTTCSIILQENSHDRNYFGREFLQVDLIQIMEKLVPTCITQVQYNHPGPEHIKVALTNPGEVEKDSLNTDAHLRSSFFGRSENIILEKGNLNLGDFGFIYFVDWDQVRERERIAEVLVMGE